MPLKKKKQMAAPKMPPPAPVPQQQRTPMKQVIHLAGEQVGEFLRAVPEAHRALAVAVYPLLTNAGLSDAGAKFLADSVNVLGRLASINRRASEAAKLNGAALNVTQDSRAVVLRAYELIDQVEAAKA